VVAHVVLADRLQERVGADQVGLHEGPRVGQRVVVVRLGGKVHDQVGLSHEPVDELGVGNVALDEGDLVQHAIERGLGARVGQCIQDGDLRVRALGEGQVDEVATDEPGAAGDEDLHAAQPTDARRWSRLARGR